MTNTKQTTATEPDPFIDHGIRLADAEERVNELQDVVDEARELVHEVRGRIAASDPNVTPADLAAAAAGVEFAALQQYGALMSQYRLRKSAPFRPVVADSVADTLTSALGFPVKRVERVPAPAKKGSTPVAYVVQRAGATRGWGGPKSTHSSLTAQIDITLHRHDLAYVKGLDTATVTEVLNEAGISTSTFGDSGETDRISGLTVSAKFPHNDVKSSMLKPDVTHADIPTYPRLVFEVNEPSANNAMYR
ncbi:hypothetical protein [Isoptericola sediminis]|uniref:Uncharacterized protein n=1 Tax=Isoptericola sediminis TaxID=2733572 RepID=A0A849K4S6_9MICO|nr:hypothetical protein [Isoptericola sediminis]NNU26795.1 hypothetical protein [Isoptericola sediminis]